MNDIISNKWILGALLAALLGWLAAKGYIKP